MWADKIMQQPVNIQAALQGTFNLAYVSAIPAGKI